MKGETIPSWVMDRLQTSCRSFRYELPFNKKVLEEMTPVQFLANHTRLERDQRRHYTEIFKKFKQKSTEFLDGKSLYAALNSMFGSYLSTSNYEILQTCLFITDDSLFDVNTFAGICAFTDRLFWTAYLDGEVDTFTIWAPNRTALEFADFENLKRKLKDFNLSKEMRVLLYSLA
ncbi:unnamed protein product [Lymnaea stagnalis]|uniref:Uncharacterized protein n=1 Tax=Lymnaea stagnalis TaxID=6523 RepID=A0AAV2HXK5_LYMST